MENIQTISNYRKYSNQDLIEMITWLWVERLIDDKTRDKYIDAIFKRRHDKLTNDEERREAQKRNALQWYYRKKLINMYTINSNLI